MKRLLVGLLVVGAVALDARGSGSPLAHVATGVPVRAATEPLEGPAVSHGDFLQPGPYPDTNTPNGPICSLDDYVDCVDESLSDCGFKQGYAFGLVGWMANSAWKIATFKTAIALGSAACVGPAAIGCLIGCQGSPVQCDVPGGVASCFQTCPPTTEPTGEECVVQAGQPPVLGICCEIHGHD